MAPPIISAVIDTYNQEHFIEQAIVSVLEQGLSPSEMEVVVVDDGSADRTPEIVRKFEPRVRLIRKPNGGQASAFNAGIGAATAELVAFLDGDDWWAPGKVEAVLAAFDAHPDVAAVGHGYFEVLGDTPTGEMLVSQRSLLLNLSSVEAARVASIGRMLLGTSRLAVRQRALKQVGPVPLELVYAADTPILVLALALGGALILEQPLCYYRLHADQAGSANKSASVHDVHHTFVEDRDYHFVKFILQLLPQRLKDLGVPTDVIAVFFEQDRIDMERFELRRSGGGRWGTLKAEMRAYRSSYKGATVGYGVFRGFLAALALLLGPRRFYDLRDWYARRRSLHRLRATLGAAEPAVPVNLLQRRAVSARDARL
jgi:glycosyltransferase involved in cell wall biosynthesis